MKIFLYKANYVLIFFLALLNIALRIPWSPHGVDVTDSALIWSLVNSISISGYIKWALHPISLFGLYPLSYPSASPLFLSIASQLTGSDAENTILIYGFLLALLGVFGSYIMALEIRKDHLFAFITSFAFSTAPVFIEYTRWTATTRNMFIALFPLFLWTLFWINNNKKYTNKIFLLGLFFSITLCASHRLSFLLLLVLIGYFLTMAICYARDKTHIIKYTSRLPENAKFFAIILLCIIIFLPQFSGIGFFNGILSQYQKGAFGNGNSFPILLLNLSMNYVGSIGILSLFGMVGFLTLLRKVNKSYNEIFIIVVLIIASSILALGLYVSLFILPFVSLFIALFICDILDLSQSDLKRLHHALTGAPLIAKKMPVILLVICLVTSISFSCYIISRHMYAQIGDTGDKTWITDEIIYGGLFIKNEGAKAFLSNDKLLERRIYALTGIPSFGRDEIVHLTEGWIDKNELQISPLKSANIVKTNYIYSSNAPSVINDVKMAYNNDYRESYMQSIFNKYNVTIFVLNNRLPNELVWNSKGYESKGIKSITTYGYKMYDNNYLSIWSLQK